MTSLSKRANIILSAVVEEYTAHGEAVSSGTLAKKYGLGLSAATIRSVLADLEAGGYLLQHYTSAGRVPTEQAFRLFVDAVLATQQTAPREMGRIRACLGELRGPGEVARGAGRLLADMTGRAAVVLLPATGSSELTTLRFVRTGPDQLLAVMVLSDGRVEHHFVTPEHPLSNSELERLHGMLDTVLPGRTVEELREHLLAALERERDELVELRRLGIAILDAALAAEPARRQLIIEGEARLLEQAATHDAGRLEHLLLALTEREELVHLLDRIIETTRVQVLLDAETRQVVGYPMSLVVAAYDEQGRPGGAVGVLGPTPLDYQAVVPLVRVTASAMTDALARGRAGA